MSDEHKTDDGHEPHEAHHAADEQGSDHQDATPAATGDVHPAAPVADDHGDAPVEAVDHGSDDQVAHTGNAPAEATHHDHDHDTHAVQEEHPADSDHEGPAEPVQQEPAHHDSAPHHDEPSDHGVSDTAPLTAAAVAATAATAKPPVWSDHGDAPFEESEPVPPTTSKKRKKAKKSSDGGNEFLEIVKTVVFALLIALVLRVFLFQPFTIPSASMEPNLNEGDYIVVTKWSYGYSKHSIPGSPGLFNGRILERGPQRGDIAVFKLPTDNRTDYIKRVIGLPGDRIQMINNRLYLNGTIVPDVVLGQTEEADAYGPRPVTRLVETLPGGRSFTINDFGPGFPLDNTEVFTVPDGYYFMMGDNRDNSVDSREHPERGGVGLVPAENLIGKAQIILFSWSPGASLWDPVSWFTKLRPSRFFTVLE